MDAMSYEYLIRRVLQCGRDYRKGADASIYREMDVAFTDLETKSLYTSQERRENEYRTKFSSVRRYVRDALVKGLKQIEFTSNTEGKEYLEKAVSKLDLSFYDRKELDEVINKANDIFHSEGITV